MVVLESVLGPGQPLGGDPQSVRTVLEGLADLDPVALCQPDRCAIQVSVARADPGATLAEALRRYRSVAARTGLGCWDLVRIELLTPCELHAGWDAFDKDPAVQELLGAMAVGSDDDHVLEAERTLLAVTSPEEARAVVSRLVRQLGGAVVEARLQDEWTLPFDISFGVGRPVVAIAEPWTISRIRLEEVLPAMVDMAINRLACQAASRLAGSGANGPTEARRVIT